VKRWLSRPAALLVALGWGLAAQAENIAVPNASFELPATGFVTIAISSWGKTPQPAWYDPSGGFDWVQLAGTFLNTVPSSPDHIDNIDGNQAIWLFAVPEIGVFMDATTSGGVFDRTYEVGKAYKLTVGIIGSGGGMLEGASLEVALYYRNQAGAKVMIATTPVVYNVAQFPNNTHLVDCSVEIPTVRPGDAWAGRPMGLQLLSTVTPELEGGYWDLDNVRLTAVAGPEVQVSRVEGNLRVAWPSLAGCQYQLKVSNTLGGWTNYGPALTGTGGELSQLYPLAGNDRAFFRVDVTLLP